MKHLILIFVFILLYGCFSPVTSSEKNGGTDFNKQRETTMETEKERYTAFLTGCIPLAKNTVTRLEDKAIGFIALTENATTGYQWHCTISDTKILAPCGDDRFDFNRPDSTGAAMQHVWKFKASGKGTCRIIFKYFRAWEGEGKAADVCEYEVTVQ
ncbi:MAG: protease inhibitor I42 family protein [Pseudomonadota bacterium]